MTDTAYWDAYYKSGPPINHTSNFAGSIEKYLQKGRNIVDLGCGNGRDSMFFAALGLNVLGIDSSRAAIDSLNAKPYPNAKFLCGDMVDNSTIFKHTYDYFYSRFSLHAVTEESQSRLLTNVYGSLKEDGLLFAEARSVRDDLFGKGHPIGGGGG